MTLRRTNEVGPMCSPDALRPRILYIGTSGGSGELDDCIRAVRLALEAHSVRVLFIRQREDIKASDWLHCVSIRLLLPLAVTFFD